MEYRTSLYLDKETNEKLMLLAKKMKRSKNNLITFLINDYFEHQVSKEDILKKIIPAKGLKINTTFDREDLYNDDLY